MSQRDCEDEGAPVEELLDVALSAEQLKAGDAGDQEEDGDQSRRWD